MNFYSFIGGITLIQLVVWFIAAWRIDIHNYKQQYTFDKYPFYSLAAYFVASAILTFIGDLLATGLYLICS